MRRRDRELLARISRANTATGQAVVELLDAIHDDELYAAGLRAFGAALADVVADVYARADELDGGDQGPRVIDVEP